MSNREEFRVPNLDDIEMLENTFKNCEWTDEYISDIKEGATANLRILIINGEIIGIANFYHIWEDFYYVSTECTKDKDENFQRVGGLKTPGRLLWAYILHEIKRLYRGTRSFIVYNHAIPSSRGYHLKMGMKPAGAIKLDKHGRVSLRDAIFPLFKSRNELFYYDILDTSKSDDYLLDEFDETYLFYVSDPRVDYASIDSILNSLPSSERRLTGGIKRKNKKTKNKRKNKKTKNKKTKNKKTKNKRKN